MDIFKAGVSIDIKRTDGRVHTAVISGINENTNSATVEWFENGETKGKEIEMSVIMELNSRLLKDNNTITNEAHHNGNQTRSPPPPDDLTFAEPPPRKKNFDNARSHAVDRRSHVVPEMAARALAGNKNQRPSSVHKVPNGPVATASLGSAKARQSLATPQQKTAARQVHPPKPTPPAPMEGFEDDDMIAPLPRNKVDDAIESSRRKSSCVREVEKIEQKRRERREKQAQQRQEITSNYDTTHPQWEFMKMIGEFQRNLEVRPLSNDDPIQDHQITVCVRKRPMNRKELSKREVDVIIVPNKENVILHEPKLKVDLTKYLENQHFRFDYAFSEQATNEMIYRFTAQPLVKGIFNKGMATCFAYGQTGSGKTHTMGGDFSGRGQQDVTKGIYFFSAKDVFKLLNTKYKGADLQVGCSYFEIYSGKVFDLLNGKKRLKVLEDAKNQVQVVGLKEMRVGNSNEVLDMIKHGNDVRTSGVTSANQHSSRSHAVFQMILRKSSNHALHGKFSLIDLAGNERGADTMSGNRQTRLESAEINKSLLALKECIRALGRHGVHLPFRASILTQVLRDSFIGDNSRTCMIAMVSPSMNCCEHSLNTLRYADRVKELGPSGPGEAKAEAPRVEQPESRQNLSSQSSDLALLRSGNEKDLSDDLLTFHVEVNHLLELEDDMLDEFKKVREMDKKLTREDDRLEKLTEEVDYDSEMFARALGHSISERLSVYQKLNSKVLAFQQECLKEETLSRQFSANKKG